MPVVDRIAGDYSEDVAFVAVAWKGTLEETQLAAEELIPSGHVRWGLDEQQEVFAAFGVPYQPVTVLITGDDRVAASWPGLASETEIRKALDDLVARGA